MKLWLRLIVQLVSWRTRTPLQIHEVAKRKFRVWPTDLDIYAHMNNGVFLTILDLGRYDHGKRTGIWKQVEKAWLVSGRCCREHHIQKVFRALARIHPRE